MAEDIDQFHIRRGQLGDCKLSVDYRGGYEIENGQSGSEIIRFDTDRSQIDA